MLNNLYTNDAIHFVPGLRKTRPHFWGRALRAGRDGIRTGFLREIAQWAGVVRNVEVWAKQVQGLLVGV